MATMLMMPTKRTGEGMTIEKRAKDQEVVTGKTKDEEEKRAMFEEEVEVAGDGSGITERPKRKMLARYPKAYVEFVLGMGRPTTFAVWSDELLEKVSPERRAHIRAEQQELAAYAQKQIDRYEQMKEQYPRTGYADIELSDLEDDDIVVIDELIGTDAF